MKIYSLFFSFGLTILLAGIHSATLTVENNCPHTIWPAIISTDGAAQSSNTGFELASQTSNSIDVPDSWRGRIWARTRCKSDSSGRFICATADCGSNRVACNGELGAPPASLLEFSLASNGGQDFYDISLVDGFNLPVSITPRGGSGPSCANISCAANVNAVCPSELALTDKESDGGIIGCKSACLVFNQPQYCCTGEYNSADTCKATNYSMIFKNQCPQAYSYAYDDSSSTFSCTGGPNYLITFCPSHMGPFLLSCSLYFSTI